MSANPYEALIGEFLLDARERLERIEDHTLRLGRGDIGAAGDELLEGIRRDLHTLKGNSGMMGFQDIQRDTHAIEDRIKSATADTIDVAGLLAFLDRVRAQLRALSGQDGEDAAASGEPGPDDERDTVDGIRVPFAALDTLLELVAEMVIARNGVRRTLVEAQRAVTEPSVPPEERDAALAGLHGTHEALERTLDVLQERIIQLRLVPLHSIFGPLNRMVYDEGQREGKSVKLQTSGGDTPLDKALLELANDALGHLVRNAVNHGLEPTEARIAAGKPAEGTVRVAASTDGEVVHIRVMDDGAGIDPDRLHQIARDKGIDVSGVTNPFDILFLAGFSTKSQVDLGAGRGVGLGAVLDAVKRQGGRIDITSQLGAGTSFHLSLPLSVSITRALLISADEEEYAVPLSAVVESRRFDLRDTRSVNGARVLSWEGEVMSIIDVGCAFETATAVRDRGYLIVVGYGNQRRGIVADAIRGIQEIVVKGLDPIAGRPVGVAGSTILADGRPILILDPRGLLEVTPFTGAAA